MRCGPSAGGERNIVVSGDERGAVGTGSSDGDSCVNNIDGVGAGHGGADGSGHSDDSGDAESGGVGSGSIEHIGVGGGSKSGRTESGVRTSMMRPRLRVLQPASPSAPQRGGACARAESASVVSAQAPLVASPPPAALSASQPCHDQLPNFCVLLRPPAVVRMYKNIEYIVAILRGASSTK